MGSSQITYAAREYASTNRPPVLSFTFDHFNALLIGSCRFIDHNRYGNRFHLWTPLARIINTANNCKSVLLTHLKRPHSRGFQSIRIQMYNSPYPWVSRNTGKELSAARRSSTEARQLSNHLLSWLYIINNQSFRASTEIPLSTMISGRSNADTRNHSQRLSAMTCFHDTTASLVGLAKVGQRDYQTKDVATCALPEGPPEGPPV